MTKPSVTFVPLVLSAALPVRCKYCGEQATFEAVCDIAGTNPVQQARVMCCDQIGCGLLAEDEAIGRASPPARPVAAVPVYPRPNRSLFRDLLADLRVVIVLLVALLALAIIVR